MRASCGTLRLLVALIADQQRLAQAEAPRQLGLQPHAERGVGVDGDLDDALFARPLEEAAHLGAGEAEGVGDLALGAVLQVVERGDARHQLDILGQFVGGL